MVEYAGVYIIWYYDRLVIWWWDSLLGIITVFTMDTAYVMNLGLNEKTEIGSLISSNNALFFGVGILIQLDSPMRFKVLLWCPCTFLENITLFLNTILGYS